MEETDARIVLDARNIVGESIVWAPAEQMLYWVDIVGSAIHRLDPISGAHRQWETPELPTSIGLRSGGGFIVGLRQRVVLWSPGGAFETLAVPEPDMPDNRLNEGVVAPDGSFWVGSMADNIADNGEPKPQRGKSGYLYRIAPDGEVHRLTDHPFGITNSMIWTADGGFVTADTSTNTLYRFSYDRAAQHLSEPRVFAELDRGLPDGSTSDVSGAIYNCRVAGGAIAVLRPDGSPKYVDLPCSLPTSCTFGGKDMDTLYVTSARFGLGVSALSKSPHEGAVMALNLSTKGTLAHEFTGK